MTRTTRPDRAFPSIGGLVPFTTVDYPGRLSAVIFCQGCPWRCRYCHNTHLQPFHAGALQWSEVDAFLKQRRGLLDAVVFSGGEPTAQPALLRAILRVRELGYLAALHTAGMYPRRLGRILPWVAWVGFDFKAPLDARYDAVAGRPGTAKRVIKSLQLLLESGVDYELRTTVHPALLNAQAKAEINRQVAALGAKPVRWQPFRPQGCTDGELLQFAG